MSIRLAVFRSDHQLSDGLFARLQRSGCEIIHVDMNSASLDPIGRSDIIVIDSRSRSAKSILSYIKNCSSLCHVPILLIVSGEERLNACSYWSTRVDDIVTLPVNFSDLRFRVIHLSRLASINKEWQRRCSAFADFGFMQHSDVSVLEQNDGVAMLFVGQNHGQHEFLGAFEGRVTAAYVATSTEAMAHLCHSNADLIVLNPTVPVSDLRILLRETKSAPAWIDLPIAIVTDSLPEKVSDPTALWGQPYLLPASDPPALTCLRMQILSRQSRLRRQLRGLVHDGQLAPIVDGLTGLYGHGFFKHCTDRSMIDHRQRSMSLSVVSCVIEGISLINETWGYPAGNKLLQEAALALASNCRAEDLVARIGGSRFSILLNDTSGFDAASICTRLNSVMREVLDQFHSQSGLQARGILGMATMSDKDDASTLLRRARMQTLNGPISQAS